MSFRQDAAKLQRLTNNAFCQTGVLAALADSGQADPDKLQKALEQTAAQFESAALEVRKLCERYSTGAGGYGSRPVLPPMEIAGSVEMLGYSWVHITLNTLLPHCRFQPPEWFSDTIRRLLDEYEAQGCKQTQTIKREAPPPVSGQEPSAPVDQPALEDEPNTAQDLEYQFTDKNQDLGMVELDAAGVVGGEDEDEELPPGR